MKKYITLFLLVFCFNLAAGQTKFKHILITNDDGIEDADRLFALAKGVRKVADRVSIIVSTFDRSGTSNHSLYGKHRSTFEIECKYVDKQNNIYIFTTPANPADCIMIGLGGLFSDNRPDLVLSGINSGPNIGPSWFGSGTIGAARTAAFLGVKAIAFSGFDDDNKKSFSVIPDWIMSLISSGFIQEMDKNSYLTIGFPRIPFNRIKGIKLVERRISYDRPKVISLKKIYGEKPDEENNNTIWVFGSAKNVINKDIIMDDSYLNQGYIIITPMTINENNQPLMEKLKKKYDLIPNLKH